MELFISGLKYNRLSTASLSQNLNVVFSTVYMISSYVFVLLLLYFWVYTLLAYSYCIPSTMYKLLVTLFNIVRLVSLL